MTARPEPARIDVLIADDERRVLDELESMLRADARIGAIHRAASGAEALRLLAEREVVAAFLDIHMPGISGFDIARAVARFAEPPAIVVVTADEAGAVEAFDVQAVDFVLKPIRRERLQRAVSRVLALREPAGAGDAGDAEPDESIPVRVGNVLRVVHRSEVRWVQAHGYYSRLVTEHDSHLIREPISELEQRWQRAGFLRVHRSYLVRRDAITAVKLGGAHPTLTVAGEEVPVSRRSIALVREAMLRPPEASR